MNPKTYYITSSSNLIKNRAKFLEEKGFEFYAEDEYSIKYRSYERNIEVLIYFERYSNTDGGVRLTYTDGFPHTRKKSFSVGSCDVVTRYHNNDFLDYKKILKTKFDRVMYDLDFLEKHFDECLDLSYCEKMDREYNFEDVGKKYFAKFE